MVSLVLSDWWRVGVLNCALVKDKSNLLSFTLCYSLTVLHKIRPTRSSFFTTQVRHMYFYECYRNMSSVHNFKFSTLNIELFILM